MLVVSRFRVAEEDGAGFLARARPALAALADRPGFVRGRIGRAADDPGLWALTTEWESVGAFRRALVAYEVKLHAAPLLADSIEEPAAFEVLAAFDGAGSGGSGAAAELRRGSDRAADADRTRVGEAAVPEAPRGPA